MLFSITLGAPRLILEGKSPKLLGGGLRLERRFIMKKPTRQQVIDGAEKTVKVLKPIRTFFWWLGIFLSLGAVAMLFMLKQSLNSPAPAPQQQQNVVQQQTTEAPAETTEQPEIKGTLGSNGVIQEEGYGYIYRYTLDNKVIEVMEVDGAPHSVIAWDDNVNPEKDLDKILVSKRTIKEFLYKEEYRPE